MNNVCAGCGIELNDAAGKFCSRCGVAVVLPPSSERIVDLNGLKWWLVPIAVCAILVALFIAVTPPDSTSATSSTQTATMHGPKSLRAPFWCGNTFDDAGQIGIAVSRKDVAAIAGLMAREHAFEIDEGTRVVSGGEIGYGISRVHVESGFQAGRECYLPTNALQ
jgi:hypothetical protein